MQENTCLYTSPLCLCGYITIKQYNQYKFKLALVFENTCARQSKPHAT